jgi:anti-sigma regulatory factor (Ser/Thr protein kinase)
MGGGNMAVASAPGIESGEHVVQFYEGESDLIEAVGGHLAAGARAGEVVIVIATPFHRAAFEAELTARGVDVADARGEGRYLEFDAAETLARFRGGGVGAPGNVGSPWNVGSLDREACFAVVGGLVRQAVATGRRVRAYGEMVALLWEAGNVAAAIELEALWNELGRELSFSLYCAYPKASVSSAKQAEALENVCHLHSSVIYSTDPDTPQRQWPAEQPAGLLRSQSAQRPAHQCSKTLRAALNLPAELTAPGTARRFVAAALSVRGYNSALIQDAALVVTELATNAVLHIGSPFDVSVSSSDGAVVRICVKDTGPGSPATIAKIRQARHGHGLGLVAAVANRWGVDPDTDGKVVWAELRAPLQGWG